MEVPGNTKEWIELALAVEPRTLTQIAVDARLSHSFVSRLKNGSSPSRRRPNLDAAYDDDRYHRLAKSLFPNQPDYWPLFIETVSKQQEEETPLPGRPPLVDQSIDQSLQALTSQSGVLQHSSSESDSELTNLTPMVLESVPLVRPSDKIADLVAILTTKNPKWAAAGVRIFESCNEGRISADPGLCFRGFHKILLQRSQDGQEPLCDRSNNERYTFFGREKDWSVDGEDAIGLYQAMRNYFIDLGEDWKWPAELMLQALHLRDPYPATLALQWDDSVERMRSTSS